MHLRLGNAVRFASCLRQAALCSTGGAAKRAKLPGTCQRPPESITSSLAAHKAYTYTLIHICTDACCARQAGRPDGADFARDARRILEAQLREGKSVADLEKALLSPSPQPQQVRRMPLA